MIDAHCRRGGKALVLEPSERGEMIVVRHGRREMQLAWTHLLPATFGGRARMNVQNSLAAAAAAFAAGAPLHDIRQGLRTFSTNYYLSPGRLNEIEVNGRQRDRRLLPQRARHADARRLRRPGRRGPRLDGSELGKPSRIGVIATAGDRRDEDMRELGDDRRRSTSTSSWSARTSRCAGASAARPPALVAEGVRRAMDAGARCKQVEIVLDEIEAVRHAMARANPGDLVVVCVDKHPAVMAELENWSHQAQAGATSHPDAPVADPDYAPVHSPEPAAESVSG